MPEARARVRRACAALSDACVRDRTTPLLVSAHSLSLAIHGDMRPAIPVLALVLLGCGRPSQMPQAGDMSRVVIERGDRGPAWTPDVCAKVDLHPEYRLLSESSLVAFLNAQHLDARVERQPVQANRPDLVFVFVSRAGEAAVPLRVAILPSADEAGRALADGLAQRGSGSWGFHRANIAVLGPTGAPEEDLFFAGATRLACWGTFTYMPGSDAVVVPGGYAEP